VQPPVVKRNNVNDLFILNYAPIPKIMKNNIEDKIRTCYNLIELLNIGEKINENRENY
jgi:hypothetical protein